jgi:hypothetical protein
MVRSHISITGKKMLKITKQEYIKICEERLAPILPATHTQIRTELGLSFASANRFLRYAKLNKVIYTSAWIKTNNADTKVYSLGNLRDASKPTKPVKPKRAKPPQEPFVFKLPARCYPKVKREPKIKPIELEPTKVKLIMPPIATNWIGGTPTSKGQNANN